MVNAIWSADLIFAMWTFNIVALRMPLRTFVGREAIVRAREDPRLVCHVRTLRRAALWHILGFRGALYVSMSIAARILKLA